MDKYQISKEKAQIEISNLLQPSDSDSVFHYTSINALYNIIINSELRITNSMYLNDRNEFIDFVDELKFCLINNEKHFNNQIYKDRSFLDEMKTNHSTQRYENHNKAYYVLSTCSSMGDLPMWNYYSKGDGVCIEFDKNLLFEIISDATSEISDSKCYAYQCIYSRNEKQEILNTALNIVSNLFDEYNELNKSMWNILSPFSFSFKNSQFNYEKEFRILVKIDTDKLEELSTVKKGRITYDFFPTEENIKPCIKIRFEKLPIKKIIISPVNRNETVVNGLKLFLSKYDYRNILVDKYESPLRSQY